MRDGLPLPVRHVGAALGRMDRSHLLGAGVAVLGTFLAAAAIRNKQLSHALRDKDRDMAQLVTKVRSSPPSPAGSACLGCVRILRYACMLNAPCSKQAAWSPMQERRMHAACASLQLVLPQVMQPCPGCAVSNVARCGRCSTFSTRCSPPATSPLCVTPLPHAPSPLRAEGSPACDLWWF